ncbi:MAG TPA: alpha/beta hydrolase [Solirubrobacteraceae bacterium]|nr:alpha/beta hydrolase [Solirubrobacteraceae bacterium]
MRVEEHTITIDHVPVFYRDAATPGADEPPTLYLHGAPTSSDDWIAFLELTGGIAPDLIGFGRSGKGGHLDFSPAGLTTFVERFVAELGLERINLVGHGWGGAIALLLAGRDRGRVQRLVLIDAVPLLEGFRWPRFVRLARRPVIGELLMGSVNRSMLTRRLRAGTVRADAWSDAELAAVWERFDQGTQRALLRLHRRVDEARLAELGSDLGALELPALVVWGERDPWFAVRFADAYAAKLPHAAVKRIPGAGHWPWRDDPSVIELVAEFLARAQP